MVWKISKTIYHCFSKESRKDPSLHLGKNDRGKIEKNNYTSHPNSSRPKSPKPSHPNSSRPKSPKPSYPNSWEINNYWIPRLRGWAGKSIRLISIGGGLGNQSKQIRGLYGSWRVFLAKLVEWFWNPMGFPPYYKKCKRTAETQLLKIAYL